MPRSILIALIAALLALPACGKPDKRPGAAAAVRSQIERAEFNKLAVRRNLPFYWVADTDQDGVLDDDESATLLFYPPYHGDLDAAYREILAARNNAPSDAATAEGARRTLVIQDLDQGRATLVSTDLGKLEPAQKQFAQRMLSVAKLIDQLYETQTGSAALRSQLPADPESNSLFRRNRGPKCRAPATENNPACSALPGAPPLLSDAYPAAVRGVPQHDDGFCTALHGADRSGALSDPFAVVRGQGTPGGAKLVTVPYTQVYGTQMNAIADQLEAAATSLQDANEEPLVAYLRAAAAGFRSNDWEPADEAWARMSSSNSKWYVRVGPDEVYWDTCALKAGFHFTLALINQGFAQWLAKLVPLQQEMEALIAKAAGTPYKARKVTFHLPDFIDIVVNAGDDRDAFGATIGQSLPNFGRVARENRGRTVAMVNLYTDVDSLAAGRTSAASLLDAESMKHSSEDPQPGLINTILHEATHNLGPAQGYAVNGKALQLLLGGAINSTFEELKAETGALFLVGLLRDKGLVSDELTKQIATYGVTWAFGHIAQGMYSEPGHKPKPYSQLAAIQLGFLMDQGAVTWNPDAPAANGTDRGAFAIHLDRYAPAVEALMVSVAGIKARGDRTAAESLIARYVDGDVVPQAVISERLSRKPRASMVYAVRGL